MLYKLFSVHVIIFTADVCTLEVRSLFVEFDSFFIFFFLLVIFVNFCQSAGKKNPYCAEWYSIIFYFESRCR